jgi:hypothetical protein
MLERATAKTDAGLGNGALSFGGSFNRVAVDVKANGSAFASTAHHTTILAISVSNREAG